MITVFGSLNADYVFQMAHLPRPGQTVLASDLVVLAGGKGGNQALAAAKAGASVRMVGAVGQDGAGQIALAGLTAQGVDTRLVAHSSRPTGTACISVDRSGENMIAVFPGANQDVRHTQLLEETLSDTAILLLQGELPDVETEQALNWAKAANAKIIWNLAPMRPVALSVLQQVDYLLVNEGELTELCQMLGFTAPDDPLQNRASSARTLAQTLAQTLAMKTGQSVVVTLGAMGCTAHHLGQQFDVPAMPITAVDTVGAGDAFAGAFAAALDQGEDFATALECGNVAGALTCLQPGAQSALPTREQILAHLSRLP